LAPFGGSTRRQPDPASNPSNGKALIDRRI
jgi:hypothetical protein